MRSDVKHLSKCGYNSLYYCQMHRAGMLETDFRSECAYKRKLRSDRICRDHNHVTVMYDEKVYTSGCPLCRLGEENINLHQEINGFTFKLGAPPR